jgi:formylglycine-generating enzyme required for sulfatase activity
VDCLSWFDCMEALPRMGLELPTEAQWERACRAGTRTVFWCGDDAASIGALRAGNVLDQAAGDDAGSPGEAFDDGVAFGSPVGAFSANPYGLHDVIGNAYEWCRDGYHERSYRTMPKGSDGLRQPDVFEYAVRRGGNYGRLASLARSAYRQETLLQKRNGGVRAARRVLP